MKQALLKKMASTGFGDFEYCQVCFAKRNTKINGRNLKQIAATFYGKAGPSEQADAAIKLFIDTRGESRVDMVYHKMNETDVAAIMRAPFVGVACDAGIRSDKGTSIPHPRGSGNNPRVLARYVRERQVISLPLAIQKMTRLPARTFGLAGRGGIRIGYHADLVVFDPETIQDAATYQAPRRTPKGIAYVLVNGVVVVKDGQHNGARPGMVLRRAKRRSRDRQQTKR